MDNAYVTLDLKDKTVSKAKDVMNNATNTENALKVNAFVNLDGRE
jgi:hypothetical protein